MPLMMRRLLMIVGWSWIIAAALYTAVGFTTGTGLHAWLADWQVGRAGSANAFFTFAGLFVALALPGAVIAFTAQKVPWTSLQLTEEQDANRSLGWGTVVYLLAVAVVCGAIALMLWRESAGGASLDDPMQTVDLASLGDQEPLTGHVQLRGGIIDTDRVLTVTEGAGLRARTTIYAPIITGPGSGGEAADAPLRFVYREVGSSDAPSPPIPVFRGPTGILIEKTLPAQVQQEFARARLPLASPHFVLVTSEHGARTYPGQALLVLGPAAGIFLVLAIWAAIMKLRGLPLRL